MKRAIIGGLLSLVGCLWAVAVFLAAGLNPTSGWYTPPGRFLTSVSELGLMPFFVISILMTVLGIVLMAVEYFGKDR